MKLSKRVIRTAGQMKPTTGWTSIIMGWSREIIKLEEENEQLQDALYHSGYDWTDCIDCGGPPHDEHCRFLKLRHLFPLWFEVDTQEVDDD